jgi:hypothetical protein
MSQMPQLEKSFIFREDEALKNHLQGMTVADLKASTRPVKVWYGYPDVEVKQQEYPYVVIELYDIQPSSERQSSGFWIDDTYRGTVAAVEGETYSYYAPVTYDLFYQVSTYARNPRHDRALMFKVLNEKVPGKYGHLIVPSANGDGTVVARHMFLEGFTKQDTVEDGRRLFRNVFSIRVVSEMTFAEAAQATPQVEQINIQTLGNIPTGYETV